jgi:hypothetical protein
MSFVLNLIGWAVIFCSFVYGYGFSNQKSNLYLGLSVAAGSIFILSGITGGTVDLIFLETESYIFGAGWIGLSLIEIYGYRNADELE